jgi:hypothetical protein
MQIHEITKKPQRTNEGILDKVKAGINAVKTGYNKTSDKVDTITQTIGNTARDAQWNNTQDKINRQAAASAKRLHKQGFGVNNVDQKGNLLTPLPRASTPKNVAAHKAASIAAQKQLLQQFLQSFIGPSQLAANVNTAATPTGTVYTSNTSNANALTPGQANQQTAVQQMKATNLSNIQQSNADDQLRTAYRTAIAKPGFNRTLADKNAIKAATARGIREDQELANGEHLDIRRDFSNWISKKIPGLDRAETNPEVKQQLAQELAAMVAAKSNIQALSVAFEKYVSIATDAIDKIDTHNLNSNTLGSTAPPGYASRNLAFVAKNLGVDPATLLKIQKKIYQNKESVRAVDTGSPTMNAIIKAMTAK